MPMLLTITAVVFLLALLLRLRGSTRGCPNAELLADVMASLSHGDTRIKG